MWAPCHDDLSAAQLCYKSLLFHQIQKIFLVFICLKSVSCYTRHFLFRLANAFFVTRLVLIIQNDTFSDKQAAWVVSFPFRPFRRGTCRAFSRLWALFSDVIVWILFEKNWATFRWDSPTSDSLAIVTFWPAVPVVVFNCFFQWTGLKFDERFHAIENYRKNHDFEK